ncbi:MAG TPA: ribosome silencing factor [Flavobacteriales bacterium]|nr:ribosome silencing factor [Flavobacteriales bacterium]HPH83462.1 ribosome silencing factor [Flavobacteriales bacterium]
MKKKAASIATDSAEALIDPIIKGIEEKKGKNIQVFDLRQTGHSVCDFFVICNADSGTQVDAIAYSVEHEVKVATGESPWRSEGFENQEWILIDYVNVVVHVFQTSIRDFYKIERLWADAIVRVIPESVA